MNCHKEEYKGYIISIEQEDYVENPREWYDHIGKMICWHRRYNLGDKHYYTDPTDFTDDIKESENIILPIYLYDHSGISISTSSFHDVWDSGQVGFIYMTKTRAENEWGDCSLEEREKRAIKCLESEVEEYDQYLRGDVYCFTISTRRGCSIVDSCGGFYGFDHCIESAKESIDSMKDLSEMTQEDFDNCLFQILETETTNSLLFIPGIYEILAEHFNNEAIDMWEQQSQ